MRTSLRVWAYVLLNLCVWIRRLSILRLCVAMVVAASICDCLLRVGDVDGELGGYQEKIWVRVQKKKKDYFPLIVFSFLVQDHASGSLLVEEAGGIITDYRGRPLDFGLGRTLGTNYGVVAARKEVHAQVIEALQAVLGEEATQEGENTR